MYEILARGTPDWIFFPSPPLSLIFHVPDF